LYSEFEPLGFYSMFVFARCRLCSEVMHAMDLMPHVPGATPSGNPSGQASSSDAIFAGTCPWTHTAMTSPGLDSLRDTDYVPWITLWEKSIIPKRVVPYIILNVLFSTWYAHFKALRKIDIDNLDLLKDSLCVTCGGMSIPLNWYMRFAYQLRLIVQFCLFTPP
jgi:hypothetical protein